MSATPDPLDRPEFYADIPTKRFFAWLVDVAFTAVVSLLIVALTALSALAVWPLLWLAVGFVYRTVTLANGSATWGMRLFAMEIRTARDTPLDLPTAFLHTLGYTISVALPLFQLASVVMMCTSPRRQGLTDLVLGTVPMNRRKIR